MNTNTDAYKVTMAQAGFPLRKEVFYFYMRKGGPWYISFHLNGLVRSIVNKHARDRSSEYPLTETPWMKRALCGSVSIECVQPGNWVFPNEPIITISGPSYILSLIEPEIIQLHRYIQISTHIKMLQMGAFPNITQVHSYGWDDSCMIEELFPGLPVIPYASKYTKGAIERYKKVDEASEMYGIAEAGLRSAPTSQIHAEATRYMIGFKQVSHIEAALQMHRRPEGTMGHEHVMRFRNNHAAFEAMATRLGSRMTCLVDTWDVNEGIGAARRVMAENPNTPIGIRLDSGDVKEQLISFYLQVPQCAHWVVASGMNPQLISTIVKTAKELEIPTDKLTFQVGGFIYCPPQLSRDNVGAVYKLSWSNGPVCKTSPGKKSIPGHPITYRDPKSYNSTIYQNGESPITEVRNIFEDVVHIPDDEILSMKKHDVMPTVSMSKMTKEILENSWPSYNMTP